MQTATIQKLIERDPRDHRDFLPDGFDFEQTGEHINPGPLRFWEIDHFFKCPAIGTCLDIAEQKQILKNAGISPKRKNPFQIHEILVSSSENENKISRKVDLKLGRKFRSEIEKFFDPREDEFMRLWKAHFEGGEFEGIFWVAAIRPDLSPKARRAIFGDIHMAMHLGARRQNEARQALVNQQKNSQELTLRLKEASGTGRILRKENKRLKDSLAKLQERNSSLDKEKLRLEKEMAGLQNYSLLAQLRTENQDLQLQLRSLFKEIEDYQRRLNGVQRRNEELESELDRQREINRCLGEEIETIITQFANMNSCDETCPSFSLCRKRILIVGGMTKMKAFYRKLIEDNGGVFEYHDGYTRGSTKSLDCQIRRADVVLCPVNCNGHNACSMAKRLGKKYKRTVKMLPGSGLSAISRALLEYCGVQNIQC
ncbi:MAG: DUF2325 domain-containing protein [Deltaproteobacteria bacterium]|nr:DUF2325 domain-containing protein [Deltaproteobacteria bacterium]